jgi:O-antigen/teichoic acid export membrane protein
MLDRIESSPLGYRVAKGMFWSLVGAFISRGSGLLASILVARALGKAGFGELGIVQSTIGMLGTFAGFGLGMTATKFIAEFRNSDPQKAGRILGLSSRFAWITSSISALVLLLFAPWLATHTLAAPNLAGLLRIGSLFLLLSAVNGAQIGALSGFEAFKTVAKISLWCGLLNFPLMVGGVYIAGITGALWGTVLSTAFNWLLNHLAIRKECAKAAVPYTYKGCWREKTALWKFSLPVLVSSLFFAPTEWVLNAMLVNQPDGYAQMGLLNAATRWQALIIYLPNMLSSLTLPILSNLIGENQLQQYKKMLLVNLALLSGIALLFAIPVSILSKPIMSSYGKEFTEGSLVLVVVSAYTVLWAANIVVGQAIWSTGASTQGMVFGGLRAFTLLSAGWLLVRYGALGIASAFLVSYVLHTLYQAVYIKFRIGSHFNMTEILEGSPGAASKPAS